VPTTVAIAPSKGPRGAKRGRRIVRSFVLLLALVLVGSCGQPTPTGTLILPTEAPVPLTGLPTVPDPTQEFLRNCLGWNCSLEGTVYVNAVAPGNELVGVRVGLNQRSYCSPTAGEHEATTGDEGSFRFPVYLHDTDSFNIQVTVEGYEPGQLRFGGFDCLFCACDPRVIILQPVK
jgi:hypothetical protein